MTHPYELTQVDMSQEHWDRLNAIVVHTQGVSFEELAARRPTDAYSLMACVVERGADIPVATPDGVRASRVMTGETAFTGIARHGVGEAAQDADITPAGVVISIFQTPSLWDKIRQRETEPKRVTFHLESPNLTV